VQRIIILAILMPGLAGPAAAGPNARLSPNPLAQGPISAVPAAPTIGAGIAASAVPLVSAATLGPLGTNEPLSAAPGAAAETAGTPEASLLPAAALGPIEAAAGTADGDDDGLNRVFDGVEMDHGNALSLTRTGMLWISDKIQARLGLSNHPTYKGMSDPTVYIRGFRKDAKDGAPILSLVGANRAYTDSGGVLKNKEGRSYPDLKVVASLSAKKGRELPSNVRWRPSGRLEKNKLFPVQQLADAAGSALHSISDEIGRSLQLPWGPSFNGKEDPKVLVTGFSIQDGKPTLSITASQDAFTYYGAPILLRDGKRLQTVTVSATVVYDPKTERSEIKDLRWLRKGDIVPNPTSR